MATSELSSTSLTFVNGTSGNISFADNQFTGSQCTLKQGIKTSYLNVGPDVETPEYGELRVNSQKLKSGAYVFELKSDDSTEAYNLVMQKPVTTNTYLQNDGEGNLSWVESPGMPGGYNQIWNFGTVLKSWSSAQSEPSGMTLSSTHSTFVPSFATDGDVGGLRLVLQDRTESTNQSVASFNTSIGITRWEFRASVSIHNLTSTAGEGFIIYGNDTLADVEVGGAKTGGDLTSGIAVEIDLKGTLSGSRYGINVYEGGVITKSFWYGSNFDTDAPFRMIKLRRDGAQLRCEVYSQSTTSVQSHKNVFTHTLSSGSTPAGTIFGFSSWTSADKHSCQISSFELRGITSGDDI